MARLREKLGIPDEQAAAVPVEGPAFAKHADFEAKRYAEATDCDGTLRIVDQTNPIWILECDKCGWNVGVNLLQADPARLIAYRLERANIPEKFSGKEFKRDDPAQQDTLGACRQWLRGFKREPLPAVALHGRAGRGKSHLLSLMIETLIKTYGVDAIYRSAQEMFDELRAGIDTHNFDYRWERVQNVKVLALDDLGAGTMSAWERDQLAALVDHRYAKELVLLVATNIPPAGWEDKFGERTASRLKGMTLAFKLEGPDRRQATLLDQEAA